MKKIFVTALIIYFLPWFFLYKTNINSLPIQSEDTIPSMFLPFAILQDGTINLDRFYDQMIAKYPHPDDREFTKGMTPFYLKKIQSGVSDHYVSAFPLITPVVSVPVYFVPVLLGVLPTWENLIWLSHLSSAVIMAASGAFLYLLLNRYVINNERKSRILTYIYLFGTVNFAMFSQSLWQHGTLQLFIILGLLFVYRLIEKQHWYDALLTGFFFGVAVLTRPTSALLWPFIVLIFYFSFPKNLITMVKACSFAFMGLLINLCVFLWYNGVYYKSLSNQGYSGQLTSNWLGGFPESFFGVWLSPSKGILVFTPVLIFSFVGLYLAVKNKINASHLYIIYALIVLSHTLIISFWKHWYGGFSFGYRMSADVIPFMILLMVPFVTSQYFDKYKKLFVGLTIYSVLVQVYGLVFFDGIWHNAYDRGFVDTKWLWSIKDSEFVFNIRRILVKMGLLTKACPQCESGTI